MRISLCLALPYTATGWADAPRWGGRLRCWPATPLPLPQQWTCSAPVRCRSPPEFLSPGRPAFRWRTPALPVAALCMQRFACGPLPPSPMGDALQLPPFYFIQCQFRPFRHIQVLAAPGLPKITVPSVAGARRAARARALPTATAWPPPAVPPMPMPVPRCPLPCFWIPVGSMRILISAPVSARALVLHELRTKPSCLLLL
jgi:hypothetical protein